jgi:hypothetical protein
MKHDIFLGARIPRRRLSMETLDAKGLEDKEAKHVDVGKNSNVKSKILNVKNLKTLNPKPLHKGKDLFIPYGDHFGDTKRIGVYGEFGQASQKKKR